MKTPRVIARLALLAIPALALTACAQDPLSDLDGNPSQIVSDFTRLVVDVGDTVLLTAQVVDGRATPLVAQITFAGCDADVGVTVDPTFAPVPAGTSSRARVAGLVAGTSCVNLQGAGLNASVDVTVQ